MIPIYLSLHNFLSYGHMEQPLDFTSFHVACISGNNGNGKSSLLDGMTWALFGRARGVKANGAGMDDLVREGAEDMEVEFTFEMEGNMFKIIRKRDKRRKQSSLDLFINHQDNTFKNITGENISDTQGKIEKILKIDYDTFVQSVFLLQGQAGLFTQQTPRERKQVLSDILGLNIYDEYSKKAKEKRNEAAQAVAMLEREIAQIEEDVNQKSYYQQQFQEKTIELDEMEEKISQLDTQLKSLYEKRVLQQQAYEQLKKIGENIKSYRLKLSKIESNLLIERQGVIHSEEMLVSREEIERCFKELCRLREEEQLTGKNFFIYNEKRDRSNEIRQRIKDEENRIKNEIAIIETKIKECLAQIADEEKIQQQIIKFNQELAKIIERENDKESLEKRLHTLEANYVTSKEQLKVLQKQREVLRQKYRMLNAEDTCPLCRRSLTFEARESVLKEYEQEGKQFSQTIEELEQKVEHLPGEIAETEQKLKELISYLQKKSFYEVELAALKERLVRSEINSKKMTELKMKCETYRKNLQEGKYALDLKQEMEQLSNQIKELGYDPGRHRQLQQQLQNLFPYEEKHRQLEKVQFSFHNHQKKIEELEEQNQECCKALENEETQKKVLEGLIDNTLNEEIKKMEQAYQIVKVHHQQMIEEKGTLSAKLKVIATKELEIKEKREQHKQLNHRYEVLDRLVSACGKNGIQAIIIENALPELEMEANRLLGEMTDGRLALQLVTQRKGRSTENMMETLDIYISDEMGTRNYELYSGGEAFRISFALRVALSKILARRAGAKMQTLVIDEGFGSQDTVGREHLIEAIHAVQSCFEKVLVITHIQELKEVFDVQIIVEKFASGSMISIH